jgi:hypothetical protein
MAGRRKQPSPRRIIHVRIRNEAGKLWKRQTLIMGHWTLEEFALRRFACKADQRVTTYHMVWNRQTLEDSVPPQPLLKAYPIQDGDTITVIALRPPQDLDLPEPNPITHPLYFPDQNKIK